MRLPPLRMVFERTVQADPWTVWYVVSDSDRFNRVAGTGTRMTRETAENGRMKTVGSMKAGSVYAKWDEAPFDFEAPHWYRIERRFDQGAVALFRTEVVVAPVDEGTQVRWTLEYVPRTMLQWPVLAWVVHSKLEPGTRRLVDEIVAHVRDRDPARFHRSPPPLEGSAVALLKERIARVTDGEVLVDWIDNADLFEQERLHPLRMAMVWDVDESAAIRTCLEAVDAGVLAMDWELLCPNCRGPEVRLESLPDGPIDAHCGTCNIRFDGSFLDAVGVSFHPVPEIRKLKRIVSCAMSPQRTPHVLARATLEEGATLTWNLELPPGSYRLGADHARSGATLEVRSHHDATVVDQHASFDLTGRGFLPARLVVAAGRQTVELRNRVATDVVHIQDRAWPSTVLTAARLLEMPDARALLPKTALAPTLQNLTSRRCYVLAVEILRGPGRAALQPLLELHRPDRIQASPHAVLATWSTQEGATAAVIDLARTGIGISAALSVGSVLLGEHAVGGRGVTKAREAARMLGAGRVLVDQTVLADEAARAALDAAKAMRRPVPGGELIVAAGRPASEPVPPEPGEMLGDFRVATLIDRGGFSLVFAGEHVRDGRQVALKLLNPERANDADYVERFYNEAERLRRIDHRAVVEVVDYGFTQGGRLFIAMERLFGETFGEELEVRKQRAEPERAIAIAGEVLDALEVAHSLGIVHCDVSPSNIVISTGGERPIAGMKPGERVTLIDFGVAAADGAEVTGGTVRYMSPEQRAGRPLDGRSDLYAVARLIEDCSDPPDSIRPILDRALREDPEDRWSTAAEMRQALLSAAGLS